MTILFSEGSKPQSHIREDNRNLAEVTPEWSFGSFQTRSKLLMSSGNGFPEKVHSRSHISNIKTFSRPSWLNKNTSNEFPLDLFLTDKEIQGLAEKANFYRTSAKKDIPSWTWLTIKADILKCHSSLSSPYMGPLSTLGEEPAVGPTIILD